MKNRTWLIKCQETRLLTNVNALCLLVVEHLNQSLSEVVFINASLSYEPRGIRASILEEKLPNVLLSLVPELLCLSNVAQFLRGCLTTARAQTGQCMFMFNWFMMNTHSARRSPPAWSSRGSWAMTSLDRRSTLVIWTIDELILTFPAARVLKANWWHHWQQVQTSNLGKCSCPVRSILNIYLPAD